MEASARAWLAGVLGRLLRFLAVALLSSLGLFALLHALPGDPVSRLIFQAAELTSDDAERLRRLEGLDQPISTRYRCWLLGPETGGEHACRGWPTRGLLRGDLGRSRQHRLPVTELLGPRLEVSLALMVPGLGLGLLVAVLSGLCAARRRGRWDRLHSALGVLALSSPTHWLGLLLVFVFSVRLGWFPSGGRGEGGWDGLWHAVLPLATLAIFYWARFSRFVRRAAVDAAGSSFVLRLRARGVPEAALWRRHVLPHALLPLVPVVGQAVPGLFSGSLIVERVFSVPGVGVLFFESIERDDPMVAMAVGMLLLLVSFAATALTDVLHYALDPRTRAALSEGRLS